MTTIAAEPKYKNKQKSKDRIISIIIGFFALAWLFPIAWTFWSSLRPYNDVIANGVFSVPKTLNFDNYYNAIRLMKLPMYLTNSMLITIPAVVLTLGFGSLIAFVVSRYSFKFNVALLLFFTAGNLLPQQLVFIPLFKMYLSIGDFFGNRALLYDSIFGVVLIHVAFQLGFATFVLSSYLKTIPKEISESAMVDGGFSLGPLHTNHFAAATSTPSIFGSTNDYLYLQRFLLGAGANEVRFQATNYFCAGTPSRRVCYGL